MNETTKDGKFSLHPAAWLGWCVNDAPGVMVKKRGTYHVVPMSGKNIKSPYDLTLDGKPFLEDNIDIYPYTRFNSNNPSFFKKYDLK